MSDENQIPLNMVGVNVTISVTTQTGKTDFTASVTVQDRTTTGIRDALASAGAEVQERYAASVEMGRQQIAQHTPTGILDFLKDMGLDRQE